MKAKDGLKLIRSDSALSYIPDSQVVSFPSFTTLRTDTVFTKLPIHSLNKSAPIDIRIQQVGAQGVEELYWQVSPSTTYGAPLLLAYRLDTLVINRHLDVLNRPLPSLICLGSLRQLCQELGLGTGKSIADLKRAFHQNAGVYITAKLHYRDRDGKQRRLEAGFHRYSVIFTGESLPDSTSANAVYIVLNESYRQVLNAAPTRPLDYDYLNRLKPSAQRFYELLSFKMFGVFKYQQSRVTMRYSELCLYAPQHRYDNRTQMKKQMYKVDHPHLQSGYLTAVEIEPVIDPEGCPDWLLHYTPGPKAKAEYKVFTAQHHKKRPSLGVVIETNQSEAEGSERSPIKSISPTPANSRTDPATIFVQQFHRKIHGVEDKIPHPKEIERATRLIEQHGEDFVAFFVNFACKAARQDDYPIQVFGGLMRYEETALAAYRSRQARQAKASAEATEAREIELRQVYERDCQGKLAAYEAGLDPETLASLKAQIRAELIAREDISPVALGLALRLELDQRLLIQADLPSLEDWLSRQKET